MQTNPNEILSFVLSDFGITYLDPDFLDKSAERARFANMKRMEKEKVIEGNILQPKNDEDDESYKIRKGKVGAI